MTKEQEIAIIREFAAFLGGNSYFGPLLNELLPSIERDIRGDIFPSLSLYDIRKEAEETRKVSKDEAARIIDNANANAQRIVNAGRETVDRIRTSAKQALSNALASL